MISLWPCMRLSSRSVLSKSYACRLVQTGSQYRNFRLELPTTTNLLKLHAYSTTPADPGHDGPHVAVVGSGPAGFYTARKILRESPSAHIDMYERLPVPFGLVRFGVAPDHPEVKNCQDEFEEVASSPNYTFVGNVTLGQDLPLRSLVKHYDTIVFAYGASKDRSLGLDGETEAEHDGRAVFSARAFVGWYNGLPEYRDLNPDLAVGDTAVVIGQGNVALDVARILLSPLDALSKTDLTDYAFDTLSRSTIKHVHVVGRRGPMQAAFTIKEVRELLKLEGVNFNPIPVKLFPADLKKLDRPKRRLMELLMKGRDHDPSADKSWSLDFLLSPQKLLWQDADRKSLQGVNFTENTLATPDDPASKVSASSSFRRIDASLLFRSIGYKAEPMPGMDEIGAVFDERNGTLAHDGVGRIKSDQHSDHHHHADLYCAGWVKRGPTGVIASTMTDAFQTAEAIVEDWKNKMASSAPQQQKRHGWSAVKEEADRDGFDLAHVVHWDGWHRIDALEKQTGKQKGKPREKIGNLDQMVQAAQAHN